MRSEVGLPVWPGCQDHCFGKVVIIPTKVSLAGEATGVLTTCQALSTEDLQLLRSGWEESEDLGAWLATGASLSSCTMLVQHCTVVTMFVSFPPISTSQARV